MTLPRELTPDEDDAMATLLQIDTSPRGHRSISRAMTRQFVKVWTMRRPGDTVLVRDLARDPPPHVDEAWIAAAFTAEAERDASMREALRYSDAVIAEVLAADVLVLGTPMYNYGMPSALKAWVDQVVRVGKTFSFDLSRGDWPLEPLLSGKEMVVLSARGEFGFAPGGVRAHMNHLDNHIATVARFMGVPPDAIHRIAVEYQEFADDRFERSLAAAERCVDELAGRLAAQAAVAA